MYWLGTPCFAEPNAIYGLLAKYVAADERQYMIICIHTLFNPDQKDRNDLPVEIKF